MKINIDELIILKVIKLTVDGALKNRSQITLLESMAQLQLCVWRVFFLNRFYSIALLLCY